MMKMKWEVVDDSLRNDTDGFEDVAKALVQGQTLHVTGVTNSELSSWYTRLLTRYDRRLRRRLVGREPSEGYIVWLPPAEKSKPGEAEE
jgi:hypothetical protein